VLATRRALAHSPKVGDLIIGPEIRGLEVHVPNNDVDQHAKMKVRRSTSQTF